MNLWPVTMTPKWWKSVQLVRGSFGNKWLLTESIFQYLFLFLLISISDQWQWLGLKARQSGAAVEHNDVILTNLMTSYWLDHTHIYFWSVLKVVLNNAWIPNKEFEFWTDSTVYGPVMNKVKKFSQPVLDRQITPAHRWSLLLKLMPDFFPGNIPMNGMSRML